MSRVVIVGAGPGGATLAYLLARRGIDTVLVERHSDFSREFRGEVLLPGGQEPFKQMGLWDALMAVPHVRITAAEIFLNGRRRARASFDAATFDDLVPRWLSQPALLEMLVAEAQRFPSFRLERGVGARDLIERDGRVVGVTLADDRELHADLVVGADGRTSMVRRRAALPSRRDPTLMDVVWCKLPIPPFFASDPHFRVYLGRGRLLIASPVPGGHLQVAWIIAKGSFGDIRARGMPECLDAMAAHVSRDLSAHLAQHRDDAVEPFLLSTLSDRVSRWSRPGLLLIGDAAHTMSPVGAQGLNIAIRDAVVTANELVPTLEKRADPAEIDAATHRVEAERFPEVATIQRLQSLPPRVILRDAWWSRLALEAGARLAASQISRPRRGSLFRKLAFGVTDVRLRV
jgi:2-polyprenyl-6-methoxyphenol hydroxylase-like FAD-dependent oxidoreductase